MSIVSRRHRPIGSCTTTTTTTTFQPNSQQSNDTAARSSDYDTTCFCSKPEASIFEKTPPLPLLPPPALETLVEQSTTWREKKTTKSSALHFRLNLYTRVGATVHIIVLSPWIYDLSKRARNVQVLNGTSTRTHAHTLIYNSILLPISTPRSQEQKIK